MIGTVGYQKASGATVSRSAPQEPGHYACAFSIFVLVEIVQVFLLAVNVHPQMIDPTSS
jgi:hypothetical protein